MEQLRPILYQLGLPIDVPRPVSIVGTQGGVEGQSAERVQVFLLASNPRSVLDIRTPHPHHGLRNNSPCALFGQWDESINHLVLGCVYSREIWFHSLWRCGWHMQTPLVDDRLVAWWLRTCKMVPKARRNAFEFDSLWLLVARSIWLEQNMWVFRNQ
jgi:hypothetical protein